MTGGRDFWVSSGYRLLDRDVSGGLVVTDDFLRAYVTRPELRPVPESCDEERALHSALLADPRRTVDPARLAVLADPDIRENYGHLLGFRDRLLAHPTIEAAYLALCRGEAGRTPPLFIDQLAHVILRGMLDGCGDPIRLRAAELLFRTQKVSLTEGRMLLADDETVETHARPEAPGSLLSAGAGARRIELDVLDAGNADSYWARSDRFDTVLDVAFAQPGLDALCRVLEQWVRHFTGIVVAVQPVQAIRDERWTWHVGLDASATTILNALWAGEAVAEPDLARILGLFRLEFSDPADMLPRVAGRPVYLAMAMTGDGRLRLKPQNLLTGLPFAAAGPPS